MKKIIQPPSNKGLGLFLQRVGLAFTFLYAAINAFLNPELWLDYVPSFVTSVVPAKIALDILSGFQLVLAAWLLWGRYIQVAALFAAGMLFGIVVFNPALFVVTFRDLGLGFAALALIFLPNEKGNK